MGLGIVEVKSAVELATEAWIAQSHAFDVVAKASGHAARNIYLAATGHSGPRGSIQGHLRAQAKVDAR